MMEHIRWFYSFIDTDVSSHNFIDCEINNTKIIRMNGSCDMDFDYNIWTSSVWKANLGGLIPCILAILSGMNISRYQSVNHYSLRNEFLLISNEFQWVKRYSDLAVHRSHHVASQFQWFYALFSDLWSKMKLLFGLAVAHKVLYWPVSPH